MRKWFFLFVLCVPIMLMAFRSGTVAEKVKTLDPYATSGMYLTDGSGGMLEVKSMDMYAVEEKGLRTGDRQEEYLCLWSSLEIIPDPPNQICTVTLETIDALCSPVPGILTTATAVYKASATRVQDYGVMGDVYWGYIPGLPTGWCWILMVDWSWGYVPYIPGSVWLDRASAYNHGISVPPIQGYCGWPLSEAPPPFLLHCP